MTWKWIKIAGLERMKLIHFHFRNKIKQEQKIDSPTDVGWKICLKVFISSNWEWRQLLWWTERDRSRAEFFCYFRVFSTAKFSLAICKLNEKSRRCFRRKISGKIIAYEVFVFLFYYSFLLCHVWADLIIGDQSCKKGNNDVNVIIIDHKVHSKEVIKCNKKYYQRRANQSIQNVRLSAEGRRSHEQSIDTVDWHAIFLH